MYPLENGARDRIRTGDLFVTNEVLYRLSYTGMEWWGCLDSNQGTQRERIYSPPQLPLCHIPIFRFQALARSAVWRPLQADGILRPAKTLVNWKRPKGRDAFARPHQSCTTLTTHP